jgi:hypothetical protein
MKFNPKGLLVFLAFGIAVLLAVSARKGTLAAEFTLVGLIAFVSVELLLTPLSIGLIQPEPSLGTLWRRLRRSKNSN